MISYLSNIMMPAIILSIISYSLYKKNSVYDDFANGVKEGVKTVISIFPFVFSMYFAVGMLRSSEVIIEIEKYIGVIFEGFLIPKELTSLIILRPISYGASLGFFIDILKTYGPDSFIGTVASIIMCSSETLLYTVTLYLGSINIKKCRYIIFVSIIVNLVCIYISILLGSIFAIK